MKIDDVYGIIRASRLKEKPFAIFGCVDAGRNGYGEPIRKWSGTRIRLQTRSFHESAPPSDLNGGIWLFRFCVPFTLRRGLGESNYDRKPQNS